MTDQEQKNETIIDENTEGSALKAAGAFIWDLLKILIIAIVIIVPFRMFVAEPFVVSGSSMVPNFHNHDYLIIDRLSYIKGNPQRGDVIVMLYPKDTSQFFIKRVIGLPGDTIKFYQGHVIIINSEHPSGMTLNETYLPSQTETMANPSLVGPLGTDEYFVLGDNRVASSDSRFWGILPRADIVGKVWTRVYPFSTAGFIKSPTY
jgi:signal peptidase I